MQVFSCDICEVFKNTFFHRVPLFAAFVITKNVKIFPSYLVLTYTIPVTDFLFWGKCLNALNLLAALFRYVNFYIWFECHVLRKKVFVTKTTSDSTIDSTIDNFQSAKLSVLADSFTIILTICNNLPKNCSTIISVF